MDRESIEKRIVELTSRIEGINNWISENPKTDPNMYEMTDCLMDFANVCSLYKVLTFQEEREKGNEVSAYDIIKMGKLPALDAEVRKMLKLRGVVSLNRDEEVNSEFTLKDTNQGFKIIDSEFFSENKEAADFLNDIYYLGITGGYTGEETLGKEVFEEKKKVFSKIVAIFLYVWQESKKNLDFSYDNVGEYKQVKWAFERLKNTLQEYGVFSYEGQEPLDKMFESIKSYTKPHVEEENIGSMQM